MIYLDFNATTACASEVVSAMQKYWADEFGNPSSAHIAGRRAKEAVAKARKQVAELINCQPAEIIFTSGATESNNLVFLGLLLSGAGNRNKVVVSAIEHKAVLEPAKLLAKHGFEVAILPVDDQGVVKIDAATEIIDEKTALLSVQTANNEIGTIQPVKELSALAHARGAYFHTDAAQALGKMELNVEAIDCDFASFSAHKIYGPKGVGALFARGGPTRWPFEKPFRGGGQEGGLRPGTINVPGVVGFGEACKLVINDQTNRIMKMQKSRDRLEQFLSENNPNIIIHAKKVNRLCNTTCFATGIVPSDLLIDYMGNVCISRSSACSAGAISPSHVLSAIGCEHSLAGTTIRISLCPNIKEDEILIIARVILDKLLILENTLKKS